MRKTLRLSVVALGLFLLLSVFVPRSLAAGNYLVYVGTYTHEESKGIYAYRFNTSIGKLSNIGLVAEVTHPSFLAIHPNQKFLYAVSETDDGSLVSYAIDHATGKLTKLNSVSSKGGWPCHMSVDKTGSTLAVANYTTGNIAAFLIQPDGSLGEASAFDQHQPEKYKGQRQPGPLAHSADFSPNNRFLITSDKGVDKLFVYRFDPKNSSLTPNDPAFLRIDPASGPRHFAFHPNGRWAYGNNESASSLNVYSFDGAKGVLTKMQTVSTLPANHTGRNSTAETEVHPSGKFVYVSNRGHNSIALFSVDQAKGTVTLVDHFPTQGNTPRNFAVDPTGQYILAANQRSDDIFVFRLDTETGRLTPTGEKATTDAPVCITYVAVD